MSFLRSTEKIANMTIKQTSKSNGLSIKTLLEENPAGTSGENVFEYQEKST